MILDFVKKSFLNKRRNYVIIAQVVNTLIALIYGKLIAVYVLPEDFGVYSIQMAAYTFFFTLLIDPIVHFIKTTNSTLLPRIGNKLYVIIGACIIVLTYILLVTFLYIYYNVNSLSLFLILLFLLPFSTLNIILLNYFNIDNKLIEYSNLSIIKAGSGLLFIALFFVLGFTFLNNIEALWFMQLIAALTGIILFASKYKYIKPTIEISFKLFLTKYFRFAGPLIFLAIWTWINNYFDKYAIEYFLSMTEVGVYNASYSVGSKFFLFLSPIFVILLTPVIYSTVKKEIKKDTIIKYGNYYVLIGIPILILIYYLRDSIGSLLLSENYKEGFFIIFWVGLAFFTFTLTKLFELIFYAEQKTKIILIGNMVSAVGNIILNIILIPQFGLLGSAVSTCLGFVLYFIVIYVNFKKL